MHWFRVSIVLAVAMCLSASVHAQDKPKILYLYGTTPPALEDLRLDDTTRLGFSSFKEAVEEVGFDIEQVRVDQITLDANTLDQYDVMILSSNNRGFSDDEAKAVDTWVRAGNGLIAWSDAAFGRDPNGDGNPNDGQIGNTVGRDSNNDLTSQFGMFFIRDAAAGRQRVGDEATDYEFDNFLWKNDPDDGLIVFEGEGTSPIVVSGPAKVLAKYSNVSGNVRITNADQNEGVEIDATLAALAIAEVGDGRVIGTFDRNTFFNDNGPGSDITRFDNKQFAQNLVLWANGIPEPSTVSLLVPAALVALRRRHRRAAA